MFPYIGGFKNEDIQRNNFENPWIFMLFDEAVDSCGKM
jgi:hypothetical protein